MAGWVGAGGGQSSCECGGVVLIATNAKDVVCVGRDGLVAKVVDLLRSTSKRRVLTEERLVAGLTVRQFGDRGAGSGMWQIRSGEELAVMLKSWIDLVGDEGVEILLKNAI